MVEHLTDGAAVPKGVMRDPTHLKANRTATRLWSKGGDRMPGGAV